MRVCYQLRGAQFDFRICSLLTSVEMVGVILGYVGATHGTGSGGRALCHRVTEAVFDAVEDAREEVVLGELIVACSGHSATDMSNRHPEVMR